MRWYGSCNWWDYWRVADCALTLLMSFVTDWPKPEWKEPYSCSQFENSITIQSYIRHTSKGVLLMANFFIITNVHLGNWELTHSVVSSISHSAQVWSIYLFPGLFYSPGLSGKVWLGRAPCSKQNAAWPNLTHVFQKTSGDAHITAVCISTQAAVNTALYCPQAQLSAALIEFQTQSMLQGVIAWLINVSPS